MKYLLRALLLGLGLVLFGWFVHRAQPQEIWSALTKLHWLTPLILLPYVVVYVADAIGWQFAFGKQIKRSLKLSTLLRIRWAGEAVNNVVPSAYIGGEALKVYLLSKLGIPVPHGASSVIAGKTAQTLGQIIFLCLAAYALTLARAGDQRVQVAAIMVIAGLVLGLSALFWLQRIGPFSSALRLARKFGISIRTLPEKITKLQRIDDRILEFYREDRKSFFASVLFYLAGWVLGTLEVVVIAFLLGMPVQLSQAFVVEAFVSVAKVFGMIVPGALGFQESGIVFLCRAVTLPDAFGVSYAILRRAREVVFALIGLSFVYLEEMSFKGILRRANATSENE